MASSLNAADPVATVESNQLAQYRRACDYLSAAMIYLQDNFLLQQSLQPEHLKPRLLGHWGTCPGINLIYAGLNQLIQRTGQRTLLVTGPGHGAPAVHANLWLEGSHADHDAELAVDGHGFAELIRRFSWPGGFPSHLSPEVPGVIHEGGELGYALATAFGAALDKPDLLVACIVGDGEAETGPTAASWQSGKFLDPATSGAVLPILHLNQYKISSPTVFATMSDRELRDYFQACGWSPRVVDVTDTGNTAQADSTMVNALISAHADIESLTLQGRTGPDVAWPMLIVRSPKGMGVPRTDIDGTPLEGTFHAHQVPLDQLQNNPERLGLLESWLRSYRPDELFEGDGTPRSQLQQVPPQGSLRMGAIAEANGGTLRRELPLPALSSFAVEVPEPGSAHAGATPTLGPWLAGIFRNTAEERDFRIVCPDELGSNRLASTLEATNRAFTRADEIYAEQLAPDGRIMEVLSEHLCQGWIEGYLLTGRHGVFPCYEAFASIVDSMVNQYAKFLKMSKEVDWRAPVASLNYLLTSEGWRQEHNGYSHQGPGFINNLLTKRSSVSRIFLPPDANTLLVTMRECLTSVDRINLVIAGKQSAPQWLDLTTAKQHCDDGASTWPWASFNDGDDDPDVVLACAGNIPTIETVAAAQLLHHTMPEMRVRVVNVIDLMALATPDRHTRGMTDEAFELRFGTRTPVIFAFHGYPSAVHELLHGRPIPNRFHVHGYQEEGTTTTPYCLLASNRMTRHDLAADAATRTTSPSAETATELRRQRHELVQYAHLYGHDSATITDWSFA